MHFEHLVFILLLLCQTLSSTASSIYYQTNKNYYTGNFKALISTPKGQLVQTYHEYAKMNRVVKATVAIIGIERQNTTEFNLMLDTPDWNLSSIKISYGVGTNTQISYLNLCYIVVAEISFLQNVIIQSNQSTKLNKLAAGSGYRQQQIQFTIAEKNVDPTHQITLLPFLKGFQSNNLDGQFQLHFSLSLINTSAYSANWSTNNNNNISSVLFSTIIIDESMLLASHSNESVIYETIRIFNSINTVNLHRIIIIWEYQMFAGISQLSLKGGQSVDFDLRQFVSATSFDSITITYIFVPKTYCIQNYQNRYEMVCSAQCQPWYNSKSFGDMTYGYCYRCHDDCKTCNDLLPQSCLSCYQPKILVSGRCQCQVGWGKDPDGICIICDVQCYRCQNRPDYCIECNQTTFRRVSNGRCVCPDGYLDNDVVCTQCSEVYPGCLTCNQQHCLSCDINSHYYYRDGKCQCVKTYTLDNGKCIPCSQRYAGCQQCAQECTVCQPEYTLQDGVCRCHDTGKYVTFNGCVACPPQCEQCLSATECLSCKPYYQLSSMKCVSICGDNYVAVDECQDGNSVNGDGCSATCQPEDGYKCRTINNMSQCSMVGTLSVSLLKMTKDPYSNTVILTLQSQARNIDWRQAIRNALICQVKTVKDTISVYLKYDESIQYGVITLDIVPPQRLFTMSASRISLMVYTDRPALHHGQMVYRQAKAYNILCLVMSSALLIVMLHSVYSHGMTGIQLLWLYQTMAMAVQSVQKHAVAVFPSEYFIVQRIDIVLLVYFVMVVVLWAVRHLMKQQLYGQVVEMSRKAEKILSSLLFVMAMFCMPNGVLMMGLSLVYIKSGGMMGILKIVGGLVFILLVYLTVRLRDMEDKPIERRYVVLNIVKRGIVATLCGVFCYTGWAVYGCLAAQVLFTIYTLWKSPYSGKKKAITVSYEVVCCIIWAVSGIRGNLVNVIDWLQLALVFLCTSLTIIRLILHKQSR